MNWPSSKNSIDILKGIAIIVGISGLYYSLAFVGLAFTGAGHGTGFFWEMILAPFSISSAFVPAGNFFWPLVSLLLALRRFAISRTLAAAFLISHYVGVLILSSRMESEWQYVGKTWHSLPQLLMGFLGAYFASQIFMWKLILSKKGVVQAVAS